MLFKRLSACPGKHDFAEHPHFRYLYDPIARAIRTIARNGEFEGQSPSSHDDFSATLILQGHIAARSKIRSTCAHASKVKRAETRPR
jgi:hypothetical protein